LGENNYLYNYFELELMVEVGIAEYFGMAEALGIIATMFLVLYFSRKQMQTFSGYRNKHPQRHG
jgi:hypothetical protein